MRRLFSSGSTWMSLARSLAASMRISLTSLMMFTGTSGDFRSDSAEARAAEGGFYALDARTGTVLWRFDLPGPIQSPAITYVAGGKQ